MKTSPIKLKLHQPACYCIYIQGSLDDSWSDYFSGLTLLNDPLADPPEVTILSGELIDQAALLGVLNRLYGLGLPLLGVEWLAEHDKMTG